MPALAARVAGAELEVTGRESIAEWTLRRARPDEAEVLSRLAFAAKRRWGYPDRWMELWRGALSVTAQQIADHPTWVACGRDEPLGFFQLVAGPGDGTWALEHLWVRPGAMGRGVGRALFRRALLLAAASGAGRLAIDADPHAEAFYLRVGARKVGEVVEELDGEPRRRPQFLLELGAEPTASA